MRISSFLRISSLFTFALLIANSSGCGGPAVAKGQLQASNRSQALQIGAVSKVNGVYENGKCMDPASGSLRSGATWSASSSTATGNEPTVVINNATCALHITSLEVADSGGAPVVATPSLAMQLGGAWRGDPVPFSYMDGAQTVKFFVNGSISPSDFSADFAISLIYSDKLEGATPLSFTSQYAAVMPSTVTVDGVEAPNYSLTVGSIVFVKDGMNQIMNLAGAPAFSVGTVEADCYVRAPGLCPTDPIAIDSAFRSGAKMGVPASLVAADLGLADGNALPVQSCLILARCDAINANVCSYQLFAASFH